MEAAGHELRHKNAGLLQGKQCTPWKTTSRLLPKHKHNMSSSLKRQVTLIHWWSELSAKFFWGAALSIKPSSMALLRMLHSNNTLTSSNAHSTKHHPEQQQHDVLGNSRSLVWCSIVCCYTAGDAWPTKQVCRLTWQLTLQAAESWIYAVHSAPAQLKGCIHHGVLKQLSPACVSAATCVIP